MSGEREILEIYFDDLNDMGYEKALKFFGAKSMDELDFYIDVTPIATGEKDSQGKLIAT